MSQRYFPRCNIRDELKLSKQKKTVKKISGNVFYYYCTFFFFFPEVWSASFNSPLQRSLIAHACSMSGAICSDPVQKLNTSVSPEGQGLLI